MAKPALLLLLCFLLSTARSSSASLLRDVSVALARYEKWEPGTQVRIPYIDAAGAKVASFCRYEFVGRVGKTTAKMRFAQEDVVWRKPAGAAVKVGGEGYELAAGDGVAGVDGEAVPDVEIAGRAVVAVVGSDSGGRIDLVLPSNNATYTGLRIIHVADGIVLKIKGAREVSISHPYDIGMSVDGTLANQLKSYDPLRSLIRSWCSPTLVVHIVGSVVVAARGAHGGVLQPFFESDDEVELFLDKNSHRSEGGHVSTCLFCSLSRDLILMERTLLKLFGNISSDREHIRFLRAEVKAETFVRFRLHLERDISVRDTRWNEHPEWKTKPKVEHFWLEVVAGVREEGLLKVVQMSKLRKPYSASESTSWSRLMSNMSFTKFSSFVVPSEVLTLDVKW